MWPAGSLISPPFGMGKQPPLPLPAVTWVWMVEQLAYASGPWMFEVAGQFSMMSDSPTVGQETPGCDPSIQNADHKPACDGIWSLASMRPELKVCNP